MHFVSQKVQKTQKLFHKSAEDISQKVQTTTVTHRDDFEKNCRRQPASDRDTAPRLFLKKKV
jgi:hypothetical protein